MLPSDEFMSSLRRDKKAEAIASEVRLRFQSNRDAMLEAFSGLTTEEKLQAFQEISTLMSAKIGGF